MNKCLSCPQALLNVLHNTKESAFFLVGLPRAGKSTLAAYLSAYCFPAQPVPVYDTDALISQSLGLSVPDIFSARGEAFFREQETLCLQKILQKPAPYIVATGGGLPCFHGHMSQMNRQGTTLYVQAAWQTIHKRLHATVANPHPLLKDKQPAVHSIQQTFSHRLPVYEQAHYCIDTVVLPFPFTF